MIDLGALENRLNGLRGAPARLAAAIAGVPPELLRQPPSPGEWSAHEILAHIRCCCDVWGAAIGRILAEDDPTIRAISPRGWIRRTNYLDLAFDESLAAFTAQRRDLMARLEALSPADWARDARITGAVRPLRQTVAGYVERLEQHERHHLDQIERAIG